MDIQGYRRQFILEAPLLFALSIRVDEKLNRILVERKSVKSNNLTHMSMTLFKGDLCSKEDEKQSVLINELLYLIASNIDKHVVGKIRYSFCELRGNFFFALTFFLLDLDFAHRASRSNQLTRIGNVLRRNSQISMLDYIYLGPSNRTRS